LNARYETAPILEGRFELYYDLLLKRKELKQSYLDSLLSINSDLDTLVLSWFEEDILYDFALGITNYYAINSMLNRGYAKRDPMSEGLFQNPIDMSYQQVADSILKEVDIGDSNHYVSATYAYFLNGLQAYDNWQYSKPENVDYWEDYPHYLRERYAADAFELMLTRFLYQELYQIEKQYDRDRLGKYSKQNAPWLTMLSGSANGDFIEAEYERISMVVETGKPKAIKYNLAAYPEAGNLWNDEILKRHKGKVLYVKFWAPWCGPCMGNWQSVNNLIRKYNNEDFELISLCIDTDEDDWQKTITKHQIAGTHYLLSRDQSKVLMTSFGVVGIPYNIIIDKNGGIQFFDAVTTGSQEGRINEALVMQIDDLLIR
jgi:thiol-disulfide isomerase/thioredoxin